MNNAIHEPCRCMAASPALSAYNSTAVTTVRSLMKYPMGPSPYDVRTPFSVKTPMAACILKKKCQQTSKNEVVAVRFYSPVYITFVIQ